MLKLRKSIINPRTSFVVPRTSFVVPRGLPPLTLERGRTGSEEGLPLGRSTQRGQAGWLPPTGRGERAERAEAGSPRSYEGSPRIY